MSKGTVVARTFFLTVWPKSLENVGISSDFDDIPALHNALEDLWLDIGGSHYTAICESADGKRHIHDVVTFDKPKRLSSVAKLYGAAHVEIMRGTKEDAIKYINKEGKFEEKGEVILDKWGNPGAIENNAGSRTDLADFDAKALDPNFSLDAFLLGISNMRSIQMYRDRFFRLKRVQSSEWRTVKVYYVEGEAGSGKTKGALDRFPGAFKCSVDEKSSFPFEGYQCEDVLILDELRPGVFSHAYLMQILDGYKLNVNVKGGSCPACWTTVVISTAFPLSKWYDKPFDGCENYQSQLLRRITRHIKAVDCVWYDFDSLHPLLGDVDEPVPAPEPVVETPEPVVETPEPVVEAPSCSYIVKPWESYTDSIKMHKSKYSTPDLMFRVYANAKGYDFAVDYFRSHEVRA